MCRSARLALLVAALITAGCLRPSAASAASSVPDPLSLASGGATAAGCDLGVAPICAIGDAVTRGAGTIVGAGVGAAGDAVMSGIVSWASEGAAWLVRQVATQVEHSSRPQLGAAWFSERYAAMRNTAIVLSLAFLLASILQSALRQDLAMLARSVLFALPVALLLAFAAVSLVESMLAVTDALTASSLSGLGGDVHDGFEAVAKALAPGAATAPALPSLVIFLGAALTALLALLVWMELVLREAAIYLAVAFLPLTLAGLVWRQTAHWSRRLAEWLAALILGKLTIAVAFSLAGAMLAHGDAGGGLTVVLGGCAVLMVAAMSPWMLLRLIPFAAAASDGLHRGAIKGAVGTAPGLATASVVAQQAMLKSFSAPTSTPRPSTAATRGFVPPRLPAAPGDPGQ